MVVAMKEKERLVNEEEIRSVVENGLKETFRDYNARELIDSCISRSERAKDSLMLSDEDLTGGQSNTDGVGEHQDLGAKISLHTAKSNFIGWEHGSIAG